jgi:cytochrome c-type biogenesis protein CcmE
MKKKKNHRYVVGSVVIFGAMAALVTTGMQSNTLRAVPVDELRKADNTSQSFVKQRLRVVGHITAQPVRKTPTRTESGIVDVSHFSVEEKGKTLQVTFRDALPDTFRAGGPVQVDGTYIAPGVMRADHVLTKCPSKYEGAKEDYSQDGAAPKSALKAGATQKNKAAKTAVLPNAA